MSVFEKLYINNVEIKPRRLQHTFAASIKVDISFTDSHNCFIAKSEYLGNWPKEITESMKDLIQKIESHLNKVYMDKDSQQEEKDGPDTLGATTGQFTTPKGILG